MVLGKMYKSDHDFVVWESNDRLTPAEDWTGTGRSGCWSLKAVNIMAPIRVQLMIFGIEA